MLDYESIYDGDLQPDENVQNLFVGGFDAKPGIIITDAGELSASWWGEILLYTDGDEDNLTIRQIRRVAMYGQLENPDEDPRIGVISLSSILPPEDALIYEQSTSEFQVQLHYSALTEVDQPDEVDSEEDDSVERSEEDPVFPRVEQIAASFSWQVENIDSQEFTLWVENLMTGDLIEPVLEVVKRVSLEPLSVNFFLAGTGDPPPEPRYSLPSNCPPGPLDCPSGFFDIIRLLPLRFINASSSSLQDLEVLCKAQIDGVCEVWRNKSCLDVIIYGEVISGPAGFEECSWFNEIAIKNNDFSVIESIEIYIVDTLTFRPLGGITHDANQASAYCILALEKMVGNTYLLAHELCHVMGLTHPGEGGEEGDVNTIAQAGDPNPLGQSWNNLRIFIDPTFPLNPIVRTTTSPDCFRP